MIRNLALTVALLGVALAAIVYLVAASTLADPLDIFRTLTSSGGDFTRTYYRRPDVIAAMWAVFGAAFYYFSVILTFFLVQNFLGHKVWDASISSGPPAAALGYVLTAILPAAFYATVVRGAYMFHYRHAYAIVDLRAPFMFSPNRILFLLCSFLGRNAQTSDTGKVYLIRVYMVIMVCLTIVVISTLHCVYSFIIPFIYRTEHIDASNWTLRFQLITVQLMSFPLWLDSWWSLYRLQDMHVDGVSVSQLYEMRSDKEERRAGGFAPGDEEVAALNSRSGDDAGSSAMHTASIHLSSNGKRGSHLKRGLDKTAVAGGLQGVGAATITKEADLKLAEVELDRTLCMNRIAQLEEELDMIKGAQNDTINETKINNEFLGRGFADLQAFLETGFKQLENFYLETGAVCPSAAHATQGKAKHHASPHFGEIVARECRSAVEQTMASLRDESAAARGRQDSLLEAMGNIDPSEDGLSIPGMLPLETEFVAGRAPSSLFNGAGIDEGSFFAQHAQAIEQRLRQAKQVSDELAQTERQRDEMSRQVGHLEREAVVSADELEKLNDDLAAVQAERDLLERKVNELRRELHAKRKEIEGLDADLRQSKSHQVRAMAKLSVQKSKADKQLVGVRVQLRKLNEDKVSLFREVGSLEIQLGQAQADREESQNWANTYRDMLLKVT